MTETSFVLMTTFFGLLAVTCIATAGSIVSRKLNFNYGWFSILSIAVYTLVPYFLAAKTSFEISLVSNISIAFYDATVGYKISKLLRANVGQHAEDEKELSTLVLLLVMGMLAFIAGYAGYTLGQ